MRRDGFRKKCCRMNKYERRRFLNSQPVAASIKNSDPSRIAVSCHQRAITLSFKVSGPMPAGARPSGPCHSEESFPRGKDDVRISRERWDTSRACRVRRQHLLF